MSQGQAVVVFAGVDGILVDGPTGDFCRAARETLDLMVSRNVPLVLCASKTRAEIEFIYQGLGTSHPFVCESGAAVFVPDHYFDFDVPYARDVAGYRAIEFGRSYATVVSMLHRAADRVGAEVVGFSDMSVEEVAVDCGLPLLQARLAKLREYDEPFRVIRGDDRTRQRLFKALHASHLGCVSQGRYDRVGAPVDAGIGAEWLRSWYHRAFGDVLTIGVGNRLSHLPFLRRVDIPLIVQTHDTPSAARLFASLPRARVASGDDSRGWLREIADGLQRAGRGDAAGDPDSTTADRQSL
jgi:mannosyl-3-phosphoglycerate phosphatase